MISLSYKYLNVLSFTFESPIRGFKISVFEGLTQKFRETSFGPPKRTSLREMTRLEPSLVRVLCIFHRRNMGNGGPQLFHQTSQETPTSKRQPFGPSIHHGITGSILQCKPMGCRLITGRYVLGISYGKIGKNAKIGEVWRLPVALKTLFWVTSQNASWLQLVSRQCGWSWLTMKATYKRLCPGWKKKPETWPTRFLSQDRGSKSWLRRSIATAH